MKIRQGSAADIPAIAAIELSAGTLFRGTHMEWATGDTTDHSKLSAAIAECNFWVAELNGGVAGFLLAGTCGPAFHICEVAVHQNYRGQKIGMALMERALSDGKHRGYEIATLTTDRALAWNAPYYERLGFSILATEETPVELADILAKEPNAHLRCAMLRVL